MLHVRLPKVATEIGQKIPVRATIATMGGLSGHAGQRDLVQWFDAVAPARPRVVLTHGENGPRDALRRIIAQRHNINAECAGLGQVIEF